MDKIKQALEAVQHIFLCEDEGMASGQPTKEDYLQARELVAAALSELDAAKPKALRKTDVSDSLLSEIRRAVADYMWSEGCGCCSSDNHNENGERLAVLLGVKKHEDGSGYDWESVRKQ